MFEKIKEFIRGRIIANRRRRSVHTPSLPIPSRILILAPHPDDEVFGCGALIARAHAHGAAVAVAVLSGGGASLAGYSGISQDEVVTHRRKLTLKSLGILGLSPADIHFLDFVDGHQSERPEKEVEQVKQLIEEFKPTAIFVPNFGEGWSDHNAVHSLGMELAPESCEVWGYCVWWWFYRQGSIAWDEARSIRMTHAEHELKLKAVEAYASVKAPCGVPWIGKLPTSFVKANTSSVELYFPLNH